MLTYICLAARRATSNLFFFLEDHVIFAEPFAFGTPTAMTEINEGGCIFSCKCKVSLNPPLCIMKSDIEAFRRFAVSPFVILSWMLV